MGWNILMQSWTIQNLVVNNKILCTEQCVFKIINVT